MHIGAHDAFLHLVAGGDARKCQAREDVLVEDSSRVCDVVDHLEVLQVVLDAVRVLAAEDA